MASSLEFSSKGGDGLPDPAPTGSCFSSSSLHTRRSIFPELLVPTPTQEAHLDLFGHFEKGGGLWWLEGREEGEVGEGTASRKQGRERLNWSRGASLGGFSRRSVRFVTGGESKGTEWVN